MDFALNHGYARPLGARVHGKHRSRNRDGAVRSTNVQMPGVTLRGLHDNAALVEMDGRIATAGADRQFRALIHFHFRAFKEMYFGMGISCRANEFTLADFVTHFQCVLASSANAISLPFERIDPSTVPRRALEVPVAPSPDQRRQQCHCCRRERQPGKAPPETTCPRLHPPRDTCRAIKLTTMGIRSA